jgi:valyl-tRNA synthetase
MPFISEELWHALRDRKDTEFLAQGIWPKAKSVRSELLTEAAVAFDIITQVRNTRNTKGLSPKEVLTLQTREGRRPFPHFANLIGKLANVDIEPMAGEPRQGVTFLAGTLECSIPLEGKVDVSAAKADILKEIDYHKGFLASVEKKLTNEKFMAGAPPSVIEVEQKKKADAESKIRLLEQNLARLTS